MKEINGIVICGKCNSIFDCSNMLAPCPNCGGQMSRGMYQVAILDALADSDAMDIVMESNIATRVCDELYEAGWEYDPSYCHPKRLVKVES